MTKTDRNEASVRKQSVLGLLFDEVVQGSSVGEDDSTYLLKEQRIITFLSIPYELEKVLFLGYLVCLDAFLFLFTFLPIRTVCAVFKALNWGVRKCLFLPVPSIDKGHICDLFRLTIIGVVSLLMSYINISMLYHLIRGQSVIKLYFIYNVMEIFDYLCLSFGSDVLESLFWLTIRNKQRKRDSLTLILHWALGCIYTIIHTMCFLTQAICLNVAINSHNKSLLVVMTSNQFMELKSYLFKKFDKENNYQIVARDIRERFTYTLVLIVVCVRNMSQLDWDTAHVWDVLPDVGLIVASEILIDWLKHAFVTKFNGIPVESYSDYRYQLYDDLLNPQFFHQTFSNRMDLMARKILFIPLPLACLTIITFLEVLPDDLQLAPIEYLKYGALTLATLLIIKVINMGLIIHNAEKLRAETPVYCTPKIPPIRNVNSSVKLPPPSIPLRTPETLTEDPLTTTSTLFSSSTQLSTSEYTPPNSSKPTHLDHLDSPSPEVQFRMSSSGETQLSSGDSSPVKLTQDTVSTAGSTYSDSLSSPRDYIVNSPDVENEPPFNNSSNTNSRVRITNLNEDDGLRKRTLPQSED